MGASATGLAGKGQAPAQSMLTLMPGPAVAHDPSSTIARQLGTGPAAHRPRAFGRAYGRQVIASGEPSACAYQRTWLLSPGQPLPKVEPVSTPFALVRTAL